MSDFRELVQRCVIKTAHKVKKICTPLKDHLGIPIFGYCLIKEDGSYCNIANYPSQLEYFYENKLYLTQPYLRHPSLFVQGYTIFPVTTDLGFQIKTQELFYVNHMFFILKKNGQDLEFFFFADKNQNENDCMRYVYQLHLLNKFTSYFKREAKTLIAKVLEEGYNVSKVLGNRFYEADFSVPLLRNDLRAQHFLKTIYPLSLREYQCLELFKEGRSAQATAAILNLSQRTIEHYFENIKQKLGCQSKWELLDW